MIYIAGPVTGHEDDNRPAFEEAQKRLRKAGVRYVEIPHEFVPHDSAWETAMAKSITRLCATWANTGKLVCEAVVCLPGSQDSRGARLEMKIARALDIPVYGLEQYLERLGRKQE